MEGNVGKAEVNRKETVNGRERKMKGRENDRKWKGKKSNKIVWEIYS